MQLFTAVVLAANAALVSAWCAPFYKATSATIYRQTGLGGVHANIESGDTCINIVGTYKSAKSNGKWNCVIYDSKGCSGGSKSVDYAGYKNPRFDIKSVKCPCIRNF